MVKAKKFRVKEDNFPEIWEGHRFRAQIKVGLFWRDLKWWFSGYHVRSDGITMPENIHIYYSFKKFRVDRKTAEGIVNDAMKYGVYSKSQVMKKPIYKDYVKNN